MAAKKKKVISFVEKMMLLKQAGMERPKVVLPGQKLAYDKMDSIEVRIEKILNLIQRHKKATHMIYFVMYDIEDDKVRREVSKFLERKGLSRVQKSIFLGNTTRAIYDKIHVDLKNVNGVYENNDSLIMIPISTDEVRAMKLIGQNVDFDMVLRNKNTLIF